MAINNMGVDKLIDSQLLIFLANKFWNPVPHYATQLQNAQSIILDITDRVANEELKLH